MITVHNLLDLIDQFLVLHEGLTEKALSYRMFGDTKKIGHLREGRDITLSRFHRAFEYLHDKWPEDRTRPAHLSDIIKGQRRGDAA